MAATSKTTKLKLNLWQETDKPERADFVADNEAIESTVGSHLSDNSKHLTTTEKTRVSQPFQIFNFVGNGNAQRTYTLNFSARAVFLFTVDCPFSEYSDGVHVIRSAVQLGGYHSPGISLSGKVLTVTQQSEAEEGVQICLNQSNHRYVGIAFQ